MTEKARKSMSYLAVAAGPALLAAAALVATTGAAPRAEASPAPASTPLAAVAPAARPATPEPPEPPDAPEPPRARRPWLGIVMNDEDTEIISVIDGSPAEQAGLKKGDRIVELNGHKVEEAGEVVEEIRSLDPGDTVKLRVERDGDERTITATLEGRRGPAAAPFARHFRTPRPFMWHGGDGDMDVFSVGPSRNFLGVEIHPMSGDLREYFKAPRDTGLLVNRVVEDSPAEKAGLKAGDVIISVAGSEIERVGDIARALEEHKPGDTVDVKVLRDGSERTVRVELEEHPEHGMRHRSFFYSGDDDDENVVIGFPPEARKALEESMKELHKSLEKLPSALDENDVIREEIRERLREESNRDRNSRRTRAVKTSYDI